MSAPARDTTQQQPQHEETSSNEEPGTNTYHYQQTLLTLARGDIRARSPEEAVLKVARGQGDGVEIVHEDTTALTDLTSLSGQRTDVEIFDEEAGEWRTPTLNIRRGRLLSECIRWDHRGPRPEEKTTWRKGEDVSMTLWNRLGGLTGEICLRDGSFDPIRVSLEFHGVDEESAAAALRMEAERILRMRDNVRSAFPLLSPDTLDKMAATAFAETITKERVSAELIAGLIDLTTEAINGMPKGETATIERAIDLALYEPDHRWDWNTFDLVEEASYLIARQLLTAGLAEAPEQDDPHIADIDRVIRETELTYESAHEPLKAALAEARALPGPIARVITLNVP